MGRPRKPDDTRRSKQVTIRLTLEEAEQVEAAAVAARAPTAEWIRTACVAAASGRDMAREVAHLEEEVRRLHAEVLRQSTSLGQHLDAIARAGFAVDPVGEPPWRIDLVTRKSVR